MRDDLRAEPLDLGVDARLEPLAGDAADRFLDDDPDPPRQERRDPDQRAAAEPRAIRAPASTIAASTRCGATLTLATRSPRRDDLAVEDGEDLERVDPVEPLEVGDPDVDDAVDLGQQVDAGSRPGRASSSPGPATAVASRSAASSSWSSPGSGNEDADRISPARPRRAPRGRPAVSRRPFDQRSPGDGQVARQDRPDQARGHAPTRA